MAGMLLMASMQAFATIWTVTTDVGLKDTIENHSSSGDTIVLSKDIIVPHVDNPSSGSYISIEKSLFIDGRGHTISLATSNGRIFRIASSSKVTFYNLKIKGGKISSGVGGAIALVIADTVTIDKCILADNQATHGGAVANISGTLVILNSTITGNTALTNGGAIANCNGSGTENTGSIPSIIVINSTISDNKCTTSGATGGIYGKATILNSIVLGNKDGNSTPAENNLSSSFDYAMTAYSVFNSGGTGGVKNTFADAAAVFDAASFATPPDTVKIPSKSAAALAGTLVGKKGKDFYYFTNKTWKNLNGGSSLTAAPPILYSVGQNGRSRLTWGRDSISVAGAYAPLSCDSTLKSLVVEVKNGNTILVLDPPLIFSPTTKEYRVSVPYATTSISWVETTNHVKASVNNNNRIKTPIKVGLDTIRITVTAENGNDSIPYKVIVNRAEANQNPQLDSIELKYNGTTVKKWGTLYQYYQPSGTVQTLNLDTVYVDYNTGSLEVIVKPYSNAFPSNYKYTPALVDSKYFVLTKTGTGSSNANLLNIEVTAQDGIHKTSYAIKVIRATGNSDATLQSLTVDNGTLTPVFSKTQLNYTVMLTPGDSIRGIKIDAKASDPNATVDGGLVVKSPLPVGDTTFVIKVTAPDGITKKEYKVTVTLPTLESLDATLKALTISPGKLTPAFDPDITNYVVDVGREVQTITIIPTKNQSAAVVDGAGARPVNVGLNSLEVSVLAPNKVTNKTYRIVVRVSTVANAPVTDDEDRVWASEGQLHVYVKQATPLKVYTVLGVPCLSEAIPEGLTVKNLSKGLYVVVVGDIVQKVVIR
jgi:hypothetical protein